MARAGRRMRNSRAWRFRCKSAPGPRKPVWPSTKTCCSPTAAVQALARLAEQLARWELTPTGTEGYKKAEVTLGGVDTKALSQQTMECKTQPGLYFIGEVVDVTGWLGGYNFQWAWASAAACAQALAATPP